jgi:hypothetical protein
MTFKVDLMAVVPSATAKAVFQVRGHDITQLFQALQRQASEMQVLIKDILNHHPNDSVLTAVVNAGGSSGTNGQVTITGTTGTGTKFTAKGTISGGALSGSLIIVNAGNYTVDPTTTGEAVTGGNLSGATVNLTLSNDNAILSALNAVLAQLN